MLTDIHYTATAADLQAFVEHEQRTTYRRNMLKRRLFGSVSFGVLIYAMFFFSVHHHIASACVAIPLMLLYFYAIPGVERDQLAKAIKKLYPAGSDTALGPQALSFSEEALVARNAGSESRVSWSAFQRLAITDTHAFLLLGPLKAIIIPLTQLTAEQRRELTDLLRAKISERQLGAGV